MSSFGLLKRIETPQVCGLTLVKAPHLARSYHHLFPAPNFEEPAEEAALGEWVSPTIPKFGTVKCAFPM